MNFLIGVMKEILISIGIELVRKAPEVLVKNKSSDSGSTSDTISEVVDVQDLMFERNNPFIQYIEEVSRKVAALRAVLSNSKSSIVFSLSDHITSGRLIESIIDLYDDGHIVVDKTNLKGVSYDKVAVQWLYNFARLVFDTHLKNVSGGYEKQALNSCLPELVCIFLGEVFRSRGIRPYNYSLKLYDSGSHVVYDHSVENGQKDIFGNELVYGKLSIIKYKDKSSDVYTYAIAKPNPAGFDASISYSSFDIEKIYSAAGKAFNLPNTDLELAPIVFNALESILPIVYKSF